MKIQNSRDAEAHNRDYGQLMLLCGATQGFMHTGQADFKVIKIRPGQQTSHHFHIQRESIFHVQSGRLRLRSVVGEVERNLEPGDTIIAEPGEDHVFHNISNEDATMCEIESPPHSSDDKIPWESDLSEIKPSGRAMGRLWHLGSVPKLKICGVKSLDAALECHRLGVDAIGIHAVDMPGLRWTIENSRWIAEVPQELSLVVLTDSIHIGILGRLISRTRCDTIQVQGAKSKGDLALIAEVARASGIKVIRTIAATATTDRRHFETEVLAAREFADAVLIDSGKYGGTGQLHNWELTEGLPEGTRQHLIAAGGIGPDNCRAVVEKLRPFAVDVESKAEWRIPLVGGGRLTAKNFSVIAELLGILGAGPA